MTIRLMSGAGNRFAVFAKPAHEIDFSRVARLLCERVTDGGYRLEGVMQIGRSEVGDFAMDFANPDGSLGAMCGNGARCALTFAHSIGLVPEKEAPASFDVHGTLYSGWIRPDGAVSVRFPPPLEVRHNLHLTLNAHSVEYSFADVGSQHAVLFWPDFARLFDVGDAFRDFDIARIAPAIRHHPQLGPRGANVSFYLPEADGTLQLRTFERGVEAETGACGTGAIATALAALHAGHTTPPVRLIPPSGAWLEVLPEYNHDGSCRHIILSGPAEFRSGPIEVEI